MSSNHLIQAEQLGLFHAIRRPGPAVTMPREVRERVVRLLAEMLSEYLAQGMRRSEASDD